MLQDTISLLFSVILLIIFLEKSISENKMLTFLVLLTAFLKGKGDILRNCLCVDCLVLYSFLVIYGTGSRCFGPITEGELRKIALY